MVGLAVQIYLEKSTAFQFPLLYIYRMKIRRLAQCQGCEFLFIVPVRCKIEDKPIRGLLDIPLNTITHVYETLCPDSNLIPNYYFARLLQISKLVEKLFKSLS